MKRMITLASIFMIATLCAAFAQDVPNSSDVGDLDREAAIKAFTQLSENVKKDLSSPDAVVKGDDGATKFRVIAPVDVPLANGSGTVSGCTNAIKVWFELSDGRFVNPKYYRWAPNEVFYVHVQTAIPVYVTIYQNYPGISQSKRAYPDDRFPDSYRIVKPGTDTRLPVAFQMDGNHNAEYMSIVVTRADWEGVRTVAPQSAAVAVAVARADAGSSSSSATATATTRTDADSANASAIASAYTGVVKGAADISSESALTKFAAINDAGLAGKDYEDGAVKCRVRYHVSYPRFIRPVHYVRYSSNTYNYINITNVTNINFINYRGCYTNIDDAAIYLFSDNGVGQLQLSLNKCGPNWRW
ncbi:MAG: hypothetical protein LBU65_05705 [Planctomycetaceae bacterium]|jgi:hypothetical protein|nr:hypothetical protein [Planctomycetaceae bacterium]